MIASVHRSVNEQRKAGALAQARSSMMCECECDRTECGSSFEITLASYDAVRADGCRFVVAPEHQGVEEAMVSMVRTYSVIEKVGAQGLVAQALDPR